MGDQRRRFSPWPVLVSLAVAYLVTACGGYEQPAAERVSAGADVYTNSCARCHQPQGEGWHPVYPELADNPIVTLHDPDPTIAIVLDGSGGMPGFRDSLEPEELAQVISYIRDAWGNEAPPVESSQVK